MNTRNNASAVLAADRNQPRKTRRIASERRRLTLASVDKQATEGLPKIPYDNAGLVSFLKNQSLQDLLRSKNRMMALSSMTDEPTQTSFAEKPTSDPERHRPELNRLGIGISCKKGLKPESPNQDSFSFMHVENEFVLAGIYDGHGAAGHHVSHFVKDLLPKIFLSDPNRAKNPRQALAEAFSRTQKLLEHSERTGAIEASMSGTTSTVLYYPLGGRVAYVAHVGDSKASVISTERRGVIVGKEITEDHKPCNPQERKRIEENGGRVIFDGFYNHRVFAKGQMYPGLNMSRALGDTIAHSEAGLSAIPEIQEIVIADNDVALLLCTDGVWEFIDPARAATEVMTAYRNAGNDPQVSTEHLAKLSWDSWMEDSDNEISDDITAVALFLEKLK